MLKMFGFFLYPGYQTSLVPRVGFLLSLGIPDFRIRNIKWFPEHFIFLLILKFFIQGSPICQLDRLSGEEGEGCAQKCFIR